MTISNECSGCGRPVDMPAVGEVWFCRATGLRYEVRTNPVGTYAWWSGHKVGAPEEGYGSDPSVKVAIWPSAVRAGEWKKAPPDAFASSPSERADNQGEPT